MPREYLKDYVVTDKYDVYSFGVVLLEVLWGKTNCLLTTPAIKLMENPIEESIDPNIKAKIAPPCWQVFIDIIHGCIKYEPDERPTMGEVEVQLEHALSLQEQADITNTSGDYTLLSTTITQQGWHGVELETITEDSDIEEVELESITEDSDSEEM